MDATAGMSLALRYGTSGSFFFAAVLLGASLFLEVERIDWQAEHPAADGSTTARMWWLDEGLPMDPDGLNLTASGVSWYDGSLSGADGIWLLRIGPPLVLLGLLTLVVCGFMVLGAKGIRTGWTGTAGLLVGGIGMLLLLLGINAFGKGVPPTNWVTDASIRPEIGFWSMFFGLLVGCGAALAAFSVRPEVVGRIGPDGQPLPALPVLSVENPTAFNPMASRDPRPFRQEDHPYKSFEQTGGRRTFKPKGEGEAEEGERAEAPPPAGPGDKLGESAAKPAAAPAKPPAAPAAGKPAPKPAAKPGERPKA